MLIHKTWNYIQEHSLILPGETVLVGLSGGADSVCLLLLLQELGKQHGFSVRAVHVNHNLRGEESAGDQAFAEELCRELAIPLYCCSCPVEELAREHQMGLEEAGREVRQQVFRRCQRELGAEKTALAHHRNDQAETVLFRLARGSSLGGLGGIRPCQGSLIHPLLFAEKDEILEELRKRGVSYRTDSSNLCTEYTRNSIRLQVMPVLQQRVNHRALLHMAEAAEDMAEADAFLRSLAEPVAGTCILWEKDTVSVSCRLLEQPGLLQRYVLMEALERISGSRKDLGREQLRQLRDLLQGHAGRRVCLPGELEAVRFPDRVIIRKRQEGTELCAGRDGIDQQVLSVSGEGEFSFGRWHFHCQLLPGIPPEIPEKKYTKWLDYDKIKNGLEFRTRRAGDYLTVTRSGGRKKLKSYFIDEKIPAEQRGCLPLLVSGSRVFWVPGYRISEDCKVTETTKQVLKITATEEMS
ncbi:MAG: tRNA lysidine(34) synthetase TilS [Lachnospiraceae bacterium]|nr:tRNA lysidine(34) synthetase TilS [Lachnospiraceae bacterium]